MHYSGSKRLFTGWLAALQLLVCIVTAAPVSVWAQSSDAEPPLVNFQPVAEGVRSDSQVFTATVSDNVGVASVTLHFRLDGDSLYETREMRALGNTDIYTTTIESGDAMEAAVSIQYYVEASDAAGNRTLEGFAFDPIDRLLIDQQSINENSNVLSTDSRDTPSAGMSTGRKVLYGILGVIVVGALASSSGGGGSAQPGVNVTVEVAPLQ